MKKFENFSTRHPVVFGFIVIVLFALLSTLVWPITQNYPFPEGHEVGTALSKLVITACFMLILWRFGWAKTAGFASPGRKQIWLLAFVMMIYNAVFAAFAFTGSFIFILPSFDLTLAVIFFTFTTSLLEETMYRGLVLTALVKAWGSTRRGLFVAAIVSGVFWASTHFVNLIVRPFPVVALQVLGMAIPGFVYAAMVLSGRSIWPVIIFHWVVNLTVNLQAIQNPIFEETLPAWLIFNLFVFPMVAVGVHLLRKAPLTSTNKDEEKQHKEQLQFVNA
ncbi:MAG: CPBP family intramembrane metalloprotease [Anaerolineales bacterium]|jgi:membrane protease YdiL (CAAX protease family)